MLGISRGAMLWDAARGICNEQLVPIPKRHSISIDVNWGLRFDDVHKAENFIGQLAEECSSRMGEGGINGGRTFTVKVLRRKKNAPVEPLKFMGCGECDVLSKSRTTQRSLHTAAEMQVEFLQLFQRLTEGIPIVDLRGIGVQVSKLDEDASPSRNWFRSVHDNPSMPTRIDSQMPAAVGVSPAKSERSEWSFLSHNQESNISLSASQLEFLETLREPSLVEEVRRDFMAANSAKSRSERDKWFDNSKNHGKQLNKTTTTSGNVMIICVFFLHYQFIRERVLW